jgi:restriction system protein
MKYSITTFNESTNREELVEGNDLNEVLGQVSNYVFMEKYSNDYLSEMEENKFRKEIKKELALQSTVEAQNRIVNAGKILISGLNKEIDVWKLRQDEVNKPFNLKKPVNKLIPLKPIELTFPSKPDRNSFRYFVKKKFINNIFKAKYTKKLGEIEKLYSSDYQRWEEQANKIDIENQKKRKEYLKSKEAIELENGNKIKEWQKSKEQFISFQKEEIQKINKIKIYFDKGLKNGIEYFYKEVLKCSTQNNDLYKIKDEDLDIFYNPENKILAIELILPNNNNIPVKEIKYIATKDVFEEMVMSKNDFSKFYDDVILQITLLSLHVTFKYDKREFIDSIVFNGYVKTIDKSTGHNIKPCILSILVSKKVFLDINLHQIDFKSCFKSLKGISAASLSTQTAIAPLIKIDRNDKRFVPQKEVIGDINEQLNLAAMDWNDFEHLVREIFEKEFSENGGEVKVTQASRDGGVDAIAFDPDPIRGGKIIIQAKRYTNTVGVNAVRDLYGTVMNEGATKGILVTTSNYGSDAYDFANGKPLTLLNGSNLLYLLERHGYKAKIDLKEAKDILEKNKLM